MKELIIFRFLRKIGLVSVVVICLSLVPLVYGVLTENLLVSYISTYFILGGVIALISSIVFTMCKSRKLLRKADQELSEMEAFIERIKMPASGCQLH